MTRALFLFGVVAAALTLTSLRGNAASRVPRRDAMQAGRCADRRRRLRWPAAGGF